MLNLGHGGRGNRRLFIEKNLHAMRGGIFRIPYFSSDRAAHTAQGLSAGKSHAPCAIFYMHFLYMLLFVLLKFRLLINLYTRACIFVKTLK